MSDGTRIHRVAPNSISQDKYDHLAKAKGLASSDDIEAAISQPTGLSQLDVSKDLFERIIFGALADHNPKTNPTEASASNYRAMLENSYRGS